MQTIDITKKIIQNVYKPVHSHAHKGTQGHALLIGGSYGKMGSIGLSTKAALRAGAGLATAFVPGCGYEIIQISVPEAMVITDKNEKHISRVKTNIRPDAIGIGPGMGQEPETQIALRKVLKSGFTPMVIDADGINILAENEDWFELLPEKTILTPHRKELERLLGVWESDEQMFEMAIAFAQNYQCILVVKGAPTYIVDGAEVFKNSSGNQALATAGSGDVLTGILTGLLAQSYNPVDAAILGVYLHGLAADLAVPAIGYESFIASDIIAYLGKAFLTLNHTHNEMGFK